MNILVLTNTFSPHVGGVARSIERFVRRYRWRGHHVKIVAPSFDGMPAHEPDVVRVPSLRHFNRTDFSVALPLPRRLLDVVERFEPDVVHSHHPFLLGGTALRVAHTHSLPLVFTHHTRYEDYTHNVPGDSPELKRFVERLATNYANLCDRVFVPSESIEALIRERGVTSPVAVVPTGVEPEDFARGDREGFRARLGIPPSSFTVGHLGRLAREKNLPFLASAMLEFLRTADPGLDARCLVVGSGPLEGHIRERFAAAGLADRLHLAGTLTEAETVDAYHAMDVFAFASHTETQGMVLTEAMAAGLPVVAIDAPGVREVVVDGLNGRLLHVDDPATFAAALASLADADVRAMRTREAFATAERFAMLGCADRALGYYSELRQHHLAHRHADYPLWIDAWRVLGAEWELLSSTARAALGLDPRQGGSSDGVGH